MIFGRGKIEIIPEKYNFSPGDIIKGRVVLKLKKPILARQLKIGFVGIRIPTSQPTTVLRGTRGRGGGGEEIIYSFEMPLDGEKEYFKGEYSFEIKIPTNILQRAPEVEGALGTVLKGVKFLIGETTRIDWYLEASLDIPKALDIKKKIKINLG